MGFKEILKIDIAWGPAKIGHDCRNLSNFKFKISKSINNVGLLR